MLFGDSVTIRTNVPIPSHLLLRNEFVVVHDSDDSKLATRVSNRLYEIGQSVDTSVQGMVKTASGWYKYAEAAISSKVLLEGASADTGAGDGAGPGPKAGNQHVHFPLPNRAMVKVGWLPVLT